MMMVAAGVAGVLGLVFLAGAIYFFRKAQRERATWSSTTGVVVEHQERPALEGRSVFTPIVKFTTERGAVVRFEDGEGRLPLRHRVGQSVTVLYDPAAPGAAHLDKGTSWSLAGPLLAAGLLCLLVAAGLAWLVLLPA